MDGYVVKRFLNVIVHLALIFSFCRAFSFECKDSGGKEVVDWPIGVAQVSGKRVFIIPAVHSPVPGMKSIPNNIELILRRNFDVYYEHLPDPDADSKVASAFYFGQKYDSEKILGNELASKVFSKLDRILKTEEDRRALRNYHPLFLASLLQIYRRPDWFGGLPTFDALFIGELRKNGNRALSIESAEDQLKIISEFKPVQYAEIAKAAYDYALRSDAVAVSNSSSKAIICRVASRDFEIACDINKRWSIEIDGGHMYNAMEARNEVIIEKIRKLVARSAGNEAVVVVGAAHICGDRGLQRAFNIDWNSY